MKPKKFHVSYHPNRVLIRFNPLVDSITSNTHTHTHKRFHSKIVRDESRIKHIPDRRHTHIRFHSKIVRDESPIKHIPDRRLESSKLQTGLGNSVSFKMVRDSTHVSISRQTFISRFTRNSSEVFKLSMLYLKEISLWFWED